MKIMNKNAITLILSIVYTCSVLAQDTLYNTKAFLQDSTIEKMNDRSYNLDYRHLIIPAVFIGYGIVGLESSGIKQLNYSIRENIVKHQPKHITLDSYTQYAPAAIVYGLNAMGIKGKHNFRDRTIIYATSQLISAAFVLPLKRITKVERPDGSNFHSFPSGHTTIAFSSAQFMFREYKDSNFWLGISGYPFAVFTGMYRVINDRHWVSDVVAGAGFGILSTELAYWLYPKINNLIVGKEGKGRAMILPLYQNKTLGLGLVKNF